MIPVVVPHGGRNLAPPGSTANRWRHPNVVPHGGMTSDVYFSKFLGRPFIFLKIKAK
jgi:hypothetical protein